MFITNPNTNAGRWMVEGGLVGKDKDTGYRILDTGYWISRAELRVGALPVFTSVSEQADETKFKSEIKQCENNLQNNVKCFANESARVSAGG